MPEYSIAKTEQVLSVRSLIQFILCSGDLESRFVSPVRPVEGIHIHGKLQKDRPECYIREVPISHRFELAGFALTITGRIDGIFQYPDRIIIDEIKTTYNKLDKKGEDEDTLAWAQVKCYAYLYCLENNLDKIETQLTYFQISSGIIKEIGRSYSLTELESFFLDLLEQYVEWANIIRAWYDSRDYSIQNLKFPFIEFRAGQREMSVETYRAVKSESQLMIQAATGIGKTMAVLFPLIKSLGEGLTSKIFYLTAKTTARAAAENAINELREKGLRLKSLTLTAKEKICFKTVMSCTGEDCEFAKGYYDRIQDSLKKAFDQDAFTREFVETFAREQRVCPFEFSLDLALWADCIICDYNYVFDPRVSLKRFFQGQPTEYSLLVDEAHNLEDRSREMFSAELHKQPFLNMRRLLKKQLPEVYKRAGKINAWMVKAKKSCEEAGHPVSEKDQPDTLYPLLIRFNEAAEQWLSLNIKTQYSEKLLDLYFDVVGFLKISEQYNECYATVIEKLGRDLRLKLFCIDPSEFLKERLLQFRSSVFFSATLTPLDYYKNILGCDDSAKTITFPSPFPSENLCVMVAGSISTLYRHRDRTRGEVAGVINSVINRKIGNYLIFFPSYEYMISVYSIFISDNPDIECIVQTPGMTEGERDLFLARFKNENSETLIGFVVLGGVFGEGIDLVGERLSGAIVVGVGLPGISIEKETIKHYFNEQGENGFSYAYSYPGINRVLQAAGRVIRSADDRGEIMLIDKRFLTYEYQSLLPEEWNPVFVADNDKLVETLEAFW